MFELTSILGRPVFGPDHDRRLGRVEDLVARVREDHPHVTGVVVRDGQRHVVFPLRAVSGLGTPKLLIDASRGAALDLSPDVLLLSRDVLDAQVIDVSDHQLERVGDVQLERHGDAVVVRGVEIGLRPVLRRLGLGPLAGRVGLDEIAWPDLHLASARGHRVQLRCSAAAVHRLSAADLRAVAAHLPAHRAEELLATRDHLPAPAGEPPHRRRFRVLRARRHAPA